MKKKIIFGITDLADVLYENLRLDGIQIDLFTANKNYIKEKEHFGLPIVSYEELVKQFGAEELEFYICVGYYHMNIEREKIYMDMKQRGYTVLTYIHKKAYVPEIEIGEGSLIFENCSLGVFSKIGLCNILYPGSMIAHHSVVGSFNFFSINSSIAGGVRIGDHCFFGNNSTTKDHISIGNEVLVGAGAYVYDNLSNGMVIVPNRSYILNNYKSLDFF